MATVRVELPSLLSPVMQGQLHLTVAAETLDGALAVVRRDHPRLALHLFDETGGLRRHVLCFYNGTNTRWLDRLDVPLRDRDTLLFMQAVSGG